MDLLSAAISGYGFQDTTVLPKPERKYLEVADRIEALIEKKVLKVGDKLLSVRALSKEQGISLSTAFQAYYSLESKGLIEARPQSGYYVKHSYEHTLDMPKTCQPSDEAIPVSVDDMINSVYVDLNNEKLLNFSMGAPSFELLPAAKLSKAVMHVLRESKSNCLKSVADLFRPGHTITDAETIFKPSLG